ncbi:hypothetical protein JTB14_008879 [Gonioctena quinquepunctata]|nr:hypothetical protein JTB14_008879 [Gonioctena quinquepunctata]
MLDRSLTYKQHLTETAPKIKSRNNIICKLAGTTWGADASTLRSTALAMTYSVAEYCAPVWYRSSHTHKIDVQLNESMRIITGTVKPTPTVWLPILANIPQLRRTAAADKEWKKLSNPLNNLPIQRGLNPLPPDHLKYRRPIWMDEEIEGMYNIHSKRNEAIAANQEVRNLESITDPTCKPEGMNLPPRIWCRLNRFRVGHGRCRDEIFKWGIMDSAGCDCSVPRQTMDHILNGCPIRCFPGGIYGILSASPGAVDWINGLDIDV